MKTKQVNNYHYAELDIPLVLNSVEMKLTNGEWRPSIDSKTVATLLTKQLALKNSPLTGNEVCFIRHHLGMSLRGFASQVAHESHVAVKKWEDKSHELTNMNFNTEFAIRVYLIEKFFKQSDTASYPKLIKQAKAFYSNKDVVNSVNNIELGNNQNSASPVLLSNCSANQFCSFSNQDYKVLAECAD